MVEISLGSMQGRMQGIRLGNENQNQIGNGNLMAVRAEGNAAGHNGNQIRYLDEIKEVNANCILMANLHQASSSSTQTDSIPESTLQLVYDVMRLTLFFKAFLVTADVSEIYMQEFWVIATVHHHYIRFKMDNKKHIINLESFREMLHICPRLPHQPFVEPPFEEEILAFL
nr:hypothetical protein [Tanacetum cinerariifolium]